MSIWCSWDHVGTVKQWMPESGAAQGGNVLSYARGFSNHHPDLSGTHERPAAIALSTTAPWCVPGHDQEGAGFTCTGCGRRHGEESEDVGPWLRMEVAAPESLSFWVKDAEGKPTVAEKGVIVVMDEAAVKTLWTQLGEWLKTNKVQPIESERP